jgi:hypothetical protein
MHHPTTFGTTKQARIKMPENHEDHEELEEKLFTFDLNLRELRALRGDIYFA